MRRYLILSLLLVTSPAYADGVWDGVYVGPQNFLPESTHCRNQSSWVMKVKAYGLQLHNRRILRGRATSAPFFLLMYSGMGEPDHRGI